MHGDDGGLTRIDEDFAARGMANIGAWILGRNMFAPSRGPWPDDAWRGWWGENPPYHTPVYVLTSHPWLDRHGGTVFHFVTGGIQAALDQAFAEVGASRSKESVPARDMNPKTSLATPIVITTGFRRRTRRQCAGERVFTRSASTRGHQRIELDAPRARTY
jgi:hypothetical protein